MIDTQIESTSSNLKSLKPKYVLQRWPVCNGWGNVSFKKIMCHACSGKGYVRIPAEVKN